MPGVERVRPAVPCLLAAALLGTIFRCAWPLDMEWKADEQRAFQLSQECGRSLPLPWIGMPSGVGTPNPGMSVWAFVALARLTSASTPEELGRAVMLANAAALALLAAFALTRPAA